MIVFNFHNSINYLVSCNKFSRALKKKLKTAETLDLHRYHSTELSKQLEYRCLYAQDISDI